ncbi:MAG: Crp/Fnr family transcriptional regulator [Ignavibacteriae bacterium]|nr:Crp/Fnr family transcriptional regulator [Ignavibacteriota bacterium]
MKIHLKEIIPFFSNVSNAIEKEFSDNVLSHTFKKGTFITMEGDKCSYFPIIKSGVIRVYKVGYTGQEITLYRINPGESCILTISCLLAQNKFPAIAVVEKDCEVLLITAEKIREWIRKYDIWAEYIYNYLSKVLMNVLKIIENISFKKIDVRIIEYLIEQNSKQGKILELTHQQIAYDIGTAREVVSRTLKELESQNIISQTRGKIIIDQLSELNKRLTYLQ